MWQYSTGTVFLDRLPHDGDLLESMRKSCREHGVKMGIIGAIGAVRCARIAFYGQDDHTYHELFLNEPAEILNCTGNISDLNGEIFVHAHITLGLKDGTTRGGHLVEGTKIFACELFVVPLEGKLLRRTHDDVTGLNLWQTD